MLHAGVGPDADSSGVFAGGVSVVVEGDVGRDLLDDEGFLGVVVLDGSMVWRDLRVSAGKRGDGADEGKDAGVADHALYLSSLRGKKARRNLLPGTGVSAT